MSGGAPTDPYFKNVALLLHGDGTNGGQNNTFIDSSSNNFTITRNGNTTQGSFNPYGTLWSNYFDGTGDSLSAPNNAAFDLGSSNFTIEAWVFPLVYKSGGGADTGFAIISRYTTGLGWALKIVSATTLRFVRGADVILDATGLDIPLNSWSHVAVSRSSGDLSLFLNGTRVAAATGISNFTDTSATVRIGHTQTVNDEATGYISNLRVVKGTAVYDPTLTTLTVPTGNLTAISNTSLLTCQSNRFIDNSTNNFAITRNGGTRVTSFAPFAPTSVYTAGQGASGYFDGSGDYLVISNNTNLNLGTGDYTFECWIYPLGATIYKGIFGKRASNVGWTMFLSNVNPAYMGFYYSGGGNNIATSGPVISHAWSHLAWVKRSGTVYYYLNGKQVHSIATGPGDNTYDTVLGVSQNVGIVSEFFDGYICDARYVKGTAVYTADFTPPTSPLTAIANTQLLCNFKNAAIFDSATKNDLETVGNAQIDTTTKKFGTGSLEFDGTGDWLLLPDNPDLQLGTGNLTVEFWVYLATGDAGANRGLVSKGTASTGWSVSLNTTQKVVFSYASSTITSSGAITLDAWNHIAVVREGTGSNQTKIYISGTNDGTGTVSTDFNQTNVMYIGANRAAGDPMKGFIDELRITKGVARYTANFTPPTRPFPDK
jgi:hypothetical protein